MHLNGVMPAPFIPYGRQTISEADIAAVVEVLRSPLLTQGPAVPAFEQAFASAVGARHVVTVNSATSALHLACLALGLGPGDRLWTSPITFVASANCARYCGRKLICRYRSRNRPALLEALDATLEAADMALAQLIVPCILLVRVAQCRN